MSKRAQSGSSRSDTSSGRDATTEGASSTGRNANEDSAPGAIGAGKVVIVTSSAGSLFFCRTEKVVKFAEKVQQMLMNVIHLFKWLKLKTLHGGSNKERFAETPCDNLC